MKYFKTALTLSFATGILAFGLIASCSSSSDPTPTTTTGSVSITDVVNSKYKSSVTITVGTSSIVLKSKGIPDHVSPYWGSGNALYEAPTLSGQTVNPGNLQEQVFVMTVPVSPATASSKEETSLGPIGMALNGVAIFNDREGGNVPVEAGTLLSFDRGGAHSGPGGLYHYHFAGDFTSTNDANLIGFLRDGFPIYGRKDSDGSYPTDLDSNGGHTKATAEFTTAIYHYHTANTAYLNSRFYILKSGSYNGTKGTFTF